MDKYLFFSERLGFRPWHIQDLPYLIDMNMDPEVMAYFPSTQDESISRTFFDRQLKNQVKFGYCFFAVELLETKEFIGFIGVQDVPYETPFTPATEIGWRLIKKHWNKGYATEGALKCLDFIFEKKDHIVAMTSMNNLPSQRVMEKIGMSRVGEFDHPKVPDESPIKRHCWYQIDRNG